MGLLTRKQPNLTDKLSTAWANVQTFQAVEVPLRLWQYSWVALRFYLLFVIFMTLSLGAHGGQWEGSGGDGVACWKTTEEAEAAEKLMLQSTVYHRGIRTHFYPEEAKKNIDTIETLEYWEYKNSLKFPKSSDKDTYQRVLSFLDKYAPIFSSRLKIIRRKVKGGLQSDGSAKDAQMKLSSEVVEIQDSHPIRDIKKSNPKCRLIQLADRRHRAVNQMNRELIDLPLFFIIADEFLLKKLKAENPLNYDMLMLHEDLYLIGKETYHRNSDNIRPVVAHLTSNYFEEIRDRLIKTSGLAVDAVEVEMANIVQSYLIRSFGDYTRLFHDQDTDEAVIANSPITRYHSFISLQQKIRIFDSLSELSASLKEEEAFVFILRYELQHIRKSMNSERLMRTDSAIIRHEDTRLLEQACQQITLTPFSKADRDLWKDIFDKALKHCKKALK